MSLRIQTSVALGVVLAFPCAVSAATWEIDPAHTSVQFAVRHLMISNVRGELTKVSGTIEADEANPTATRIDVAIEAASIDTRNAKRDTHLRSADFLDVARFPTITFRSTRVEKIGDERWKVTGDLTLHGVTRAVALEVEGPTAPIVDPWGKTRAGAHAVAAVNRRDFGITFNEALDGGGVVIGERVAITIDVEAVRSAAPAATP